MSKIKTTHIILITILLSIVLISSCKSSECKVTPDCTSSTCKTVRCVDQKCQYTTLIDCCGNGVKDTMENGKEGSKCSCPADYGECTGKAKITLRGREYDTKYLEYLCENTKCALSFDKTSVSEIPLIDEKNFNYFKLESKVTFTKPFDIDNDKFRFEFELKDDTDELKYPIRITKVLLKSGEVLIGEQEVDQEFNKVGDKITVEVPVTYQPEQLEEEKGISYKIDYEYTKKIRTDKNDDGTWNHREELIRNQPVYEKSFKSSVYLINPGE